MDKSPFSVGGGGEAKRAEGRKALEVESKRRQQEISQGRRKRTTSKEGRVHVNVRRWAYFPGLDAHLTCSAFMDQFLDSGRCKIRVFMVWNSPPWTYGVRHRWGLVSLLHHHWDACVVVFSETMELDFFEDLVKDGYGGIYLDSDIIVLNSLHSLGNFVSVENYTSGSSFFNGAVMAFEKNSSLMLECLNKFCSTYDDALLRWNGADLMTRVINKISSKADKSSLQLDIKMVSQFAFHPISSANITRYFAEPADEFKRAKQEELFRRMLHESVTFHFWNGSTCALVPEPNSLVDKLLNQYRLHCLDVL